MSRAPTNRVSPLTRDQTCNLLAAHPTALPIVDELFNFYLSRIQIFNSSSTDGVSKLNIDQDMSRLTFNNARIELLGCPNHAEACLMHELFHLEKLAKGFPLPRRLQLNDVPNDAHAIVWGHAMAIKNVIEHDVFFDEYVSHGFPSAVFLRRPINIPNYEQISEVKNHYNNAASMHRSVTVWWALEYLRQYISINHGCPECQQASVDIQRWGGVAVPRFADIVTAIQQWVAAGEHKEIQTHGRAIQDIFNIMQMPRALEFCKLSKPSPGSFRLVPC